MSDEPTDRPRYCQQCGARLAETATFCVRCGARWHRLELARRIPDLVAQLHAVGDWERLGVLDVEAAALLREHLEQKVAATASAAASASPQTVPALPATVTPTADTGAPEASAPTAAPSESLGEWAASRQADILLYLGAFLLVIAAVIFVTYQGEALGAAARVVLLAVYTAAFVAAGLLVRRWPQVQEAGRVFLALGAVITPLNFLLVQVEILDHRAIPADLIWLLGSTYCTAFYGVLDTRGFGRLYGVLTRLASLSAWGALASVLDLPAAWVPTWYVALAAGVVAMRVALRRMTTAAATGPALLAALALLNATSFAFEGNERWAFPAAWALAAIGIALGGWATRQPFALPVAATASIAAVLAAFPATGVDARWGAYAVLALGAATLATRRWWVPWSEGLARFGWAYAGATALAPAIFIPAGEPSWHGVVGFLAAALLLASIAWLDRERGIIVAVPAVDATPLIERGLFGWAAFAMVLAATAHANQRLGLGAPEDGWAFVGLALAVLLALALLGRRHDAWEAALVPLALVSTLAALEPPGDFPGTDEVVLGTCVVGLIIAAASARLWGSLALAAVVAVLAGWIASEDYDWPLWSVAIAYSAAGAPAFAALSTRRDYLARTDPEIIRMSSIVVLSWLGAVAGPIAAADALDRRTSTDALLAVETLEYRVLLALVLAVAPLLAFEGWRLRRREALLAATAVALIGGLMAIAIARPENVQAYTIPIALYLLALGLVLRRSTPIAPPHLMLHEALQLLGAAVLVLPQAEQSFEPGGAVWGFVLIGEGLIFLALAFAAGARWIAIAGVLTLSGVALRWLAESGETVPYWLTLGVAGLLLTLLGTLILLRQSWWRAVRARTSHWWRGDVEDRHDPPAAE